MTSKKLRFQNSSGVWLSAELDLPAPESLSAYALFAHCFTCSKNYKAVTYISRALAREGVAVFRFDFTGLGESEGEFSETNFSSNIEDIVGAAAFLEQEYQAPKLLIGHSLGGTAMLHAAHRLSSVKAVVTIASPFTPAHVLEHLGSMQDIIERDGEAEVLLSGRPFVLKNHFLRDLKQAEMSETLRTLHKALLILHSPHDTVVGINHAARIFQAARHPKSFLSLDNADHLLSDRRDASYAGSIIALWAIRYLG